MDKNKAALITAQLKKIFPDALCALEYGGEPWRLLVMARLSAQCTDARVNEVCITLFRKYDSPGKLAAADVSDVENIIRSCGLFHVKARDTVGMCRMLIDEYGGVLPDEMNELLRFPGVGRKVANLLLGDIYKKPAVVVDTHCIRISHRLGLVPESVKAPEKIEKILGELIEPCEQNNFCHRTVLLGRTYCPARGFDCAACPMSGICEKHTAKNDG